MKILSVITGLSVVLAAVFVQPAQAAEMIVWDQEIASTVHEDFGARERCRYSSSSLSRPGCGGNELDISAQPIPTHRQSVLDRIALFVYRYKDLKLNQEIRPGTKLKFEANLTNIYEQEAAIRLTLRIRF
jgi:hypothetical protein